MSVYIFVEGGGDRQTTLTQCREGFSKYCAHVAPDNRRPRIVACGGRQQTFERFRTAVLNAAPGERNVLLVDAEAPVTVYSPSAHLSARDGWQFPPSDSSSVFVMVQAMEAWFLADRATLRSFYGAGFLERSLPGTPQNVETVPKDDLEAALKHASEPTKTKGEYHKVKHGFPLLGLINPLLVERGSRRAKEFNDFLRAL